MQKKIQFEPFDSKIKIKRMFARKQTKQIVSNSQKNTKNLCSQIKCDKVPKSRDLKKCHSAVSDALRSLNITKTEI